ncbi:MAG: EpsG family protein, partial [Prevotella sp.]|nr:EpsG family protein [Prevotella sp.]
PVVGADTWNYYRYATGVRNFYNYDSREIEPLYEWYNSFFRNYCRVGIIFMVTNTIIIFSPIYYILKKYVKYKTFGILSFFLFMGYSPFFVALRQLLALGILLWGVIYVLEEKKHRWIAFVFLCFCAWTVHVTSIVVGSLLLILYFIPIKKRIVPVLAVVVSALVGIFMQSFDVLKTFNFFLAFNFEGTERLVGYLENQDLNELSSLNITLRTSVLAVLSFALIDKSKINHWFSKIYLSGVVLYNLFISVPMIQRMILANILFTIVIIPWIFESDKYLRIRLFRKRVNILVLLLILYFTRSYIINNTIYDLDSEQRMHPYYFFFQDYHDHPSIQNSY